VGSQNELRAKVGAQTHHAMHLHHIWDLVV